MQRGQVHECERKQRRRQVQANTNTLAAHFCGLCATLRLLRAVKACEDEVLCDLGEGLFVPRKELCPHPGTLRKENT